jgi:hypothetical protein
LQVFQTKFWPSPKTHRLGKFDQEKACRPLLVQLQSVEPKYKDINVSNDLTKTERAKEKELWEEAKKMDKDDSGDYEYKVRGPPWARKVAKIKK